MTPRDTFEDTSAVDVNSDVKSEEERRGILSMIVVGRILGEWPISLIRIRSLMGRDLVTIEVRNQARNDL